MTLPFTPIEFFDVDCCSRQWCARRGTSVPESADFWCAVPPRRF